MSSQDKLADVSELVKYTLFSDYLELKITHKEVPVSALIIANAESAKTSLVEQYFPNDGIVYANDITAWGIEHMWLDKMKDGRIKRLLIPDLINPTSRKQETVDSLITFLNAYISWEGMSTVATYAMQFELETPVRGAILATVTPEDFLRVTRSIKAVGFLSRLMPITYSYSHTAVDDILSDIFNGKNQWDKIALDLPTELTPVRLEGMLASQFRPVAKAIGKQAGAYGFRAGTYLMTLSRAKALSEGRDAVNQDDVDRINYLAEHFVKLPPSLQNTGEINIVGGK